MKQIEEYAKKIFWVLMLLLMILMPAISHDFGQNGDEDVEMQYGIDIWNYYARGDQQAIDYDQHPHPLFGGNMQGMQLYGGMFDIMTESVHRMFPSWHRVDVRHFFVSIFGVFLILFTGLLAYRLSNRKWSVALLAALFILCSPRIFGESMNNGKDIPFAMGFVMGIYYLVRILQDFPIKKRLWKEALLLGLGWGIVFGMRSAGGLLFIAYVGFFTVLYFVMNASQRTLLFANKNEYLKKLFVYLLTATVLGYLLGLVTWPFAFEAPIGNLFVALKEMTNRSVGLRVLFEGQYTSNMELPWYYQFKWIFISNPVIVLILTLLFVPLIFKAKKEYSSFTVILLLFAALFPMLYIIYKKSTVHDTWRHVFFVYPYWVVMAALSVDMVRSYLKDKWKWVPVAITLAGLLPPAIWLVKSHPHQYVYFNEFTGGPKGAFGRYDLDYYLVSGKASAEWILKNVPRPPAGKKIRVLSNMEGLSTYFREDTSWIYTTYARYYERSQHDWDYYITYGRFVSEWQLQNGKWPPAHVVHSVEAGGVPIGVVIERKNHDVYQAYLAMEKQDFAAAAALYASYLNYDHSDEMVYLNYAIALASTGRMDEAIRATESAIALDPVRPDFYQVQAQIYKAMGNMQKAQESMMRGQSILAQQQMGN